MKTRKISLIALWSLFSRGVGGPGGVQHEEGGGGEHQDGRQVVLPAGRLLLLLPPSCLRSEYTISILLYIAAELFI